MALATPKLHVDHSHIRTYEDFTAFLKDFNAERTDREPEAIPTREEYEESLQRMIPQPIEGFPGCFTKSFSSVMSKEGSYVSSTLPRLWTDPDLRSLVGEEEWFSPYGVCDSIQQFLDLHGERLRNSPRQFVLMFAEIVKSEQPEHGGWRWHKWGPYIGKHDKQCEYLYDEEGIDSVWLYEICELGDKCPGSLTDNMRAEMDAKHKEWQASQKMNEACGHHS